jgi:hypothetical protein
MNAKEIQKIICVAEVLKRNLCCENVKSFFSNWECDVLSLNHSGYLTEYEVKISKSDFKADFKKRKMFFFKTDEFNWRKPNKFYYVMPFGMVSVDQIPAHAGLIFINNGKIEIKKTAPFIHKDLYDKAVVLEKFTRVMQERLHLGKCAMTIKNEQIKARQNARI